MNKKEKVATYLVQWKRWSLTLSLKVLRLFVVFREFGKLFQIIGAIQEIFFWPWLVHRKSWFNFSKDALVVVLGWSAG